MPERSRALAAERTAVRVDRCHDLFVAHARWRELDGERAMNAYSVICEELADPEVVDAVILLAKAEARGAMQAPVTICDVIQGAANAVVQAVVEQSPDQTEADNG